VAARHLGEQTLPAFRQTLGVGHPDTLTVMNNLARIMGEQGELAGARALQERVMALSAALGEDHPLRLRAMLSLAGTLRVQGDLAGARKLQEQVLRGFGSVLGKAHPDTITAMNDL